MIELSNIYDSELGVLPLKITLDSVGNKHDLTSGITLRTFFKGDVTMASPWIGACIPHSDIVAGWEDFVWGSGMGYEVHSEVDRVNYAVYFLTGGNEVFSNRSNTKHTIELPIYGGVNIIYTSLFENYDVWLDRRKYIRKVSQQVLNEEGIENRHQYLLNMLGSLHSGNKSGVRIISLSAENHSGIYQSNEKSINW